MVSHRSRAAVFALLLPLTSIAACDKVPLLAPTGTVITLIPASTVVGLNSQVQIIATVIEHGVASGGSGTSSTPSTGGTPVQNGTVITFTTTIGRIEPSDARTHNGQVTVTLFTGNESGTPIITAYSGGASATNDRIKIGTATVSRVSLTASPQPLGSAGGTATVTATVVNEQGSPVAGVPVNFTTDVGTVSPTTATTDASGNAVTTLTTTKTAKVTAKVGATATADLTVSVSPTSLTGFAATTVGPVAGQAVAFTVTPNTSANLQNVRVNFGDGHTIDLGPISTGTTVPNVYCSPGSYTATATATDAAGGTGSLSTTVFVGALPVTLTNSGSTAGAPVSFTVGGTTSAQVSRYNWNWDDGTAPFDTTGPSTTKTFTTRGQKTIRVDVFGVGCAKIGTATLVINVT